MRREYHRADVVVSSPGGFLHEHYRVDARIAGFRFAHEVGTPLVLAAQSIGPFADPAKAAIVGDALSAAAGICVRDDDSVRYLADMGVNGHHVHRVLDAAFLLASAGLLDGVAGRREPDRVAVSLRTWPAASSGGDIVEKGASLARHLLTESARRLLFISTCQGVPGYVDDSEVALRVVAELPDDLASRCEVDRRRYSVPGLVRRLAQCDAYIGMRLHGAILAMLGGTPAAGLGYERKTAHVFADLGLDEFQIDSAAPVEQWLELADRLLADRERVRAVLPGILRDAEVRAARTIDVIDNAVEASAGRRHRGRA